MATEITMPKMGFDMEQGKLIRWLKKVGEPVSQGEPIAEIETDKAVVEVEAFGSGVLRSVIVSEGTTVPVGEILGMIGAEGEELPETAPPPAQAPADAAAKPVSLGVGESYPEPAPEEAPAPAPAPAKAAASPAVSAPAPAAPSDGRLRVSPIAQRMALEHGIDLRQVTGTGPEGRIVKNDILAFLEKGAAPAAAPAPAAAAPAPAESAPAAPAAAKPAPRPAARVAAGEPAPLELSALRQTIARRMASSKGPIPHFYLTVDVEMDAALAWRDEANQALAGDGIKASINDVLILAASRALARHPEVNRYWSNDTLYQLPWVNVGVAVAIDGGLVVPVIQEVDRKGLGQIAVEAKDLAVKAREGTLSQTELTNGSISISNLGMFDIDRFEAIINPPQSALVAVGKVAKKPVVKNDELAIASIMTLTASFDHRILDGAQAARFVKTLKGMLENPLAMLL